MPTKLEKLAAAREENKSWLEAGNDSESGEFIMLKAKSAHSKQIATNSVTIKHKESGRKYGISVTSLGLGKDAVVDETLLEIQELIATFLETVHSSL